MALSTNAEKISFEKFVHPQSLSLIANTPKNDSCILPADMPAAKPAPDDYVGRQHRDQTDDQCSAEHIL